MLELSSEDALRLNVLAAQADAVRIDEGKMIVYALIGDREMKVELNPTGRHEAYLKAVRELLSSVALDSPGGYPIYLQRWTRMGQIDHGRLKQLLRLGEPEAVIAVAGAPSLDDELARLVWWAAHGTDVARRMLEREAVVHGTMGPILARFLIEFLPFEENPLEMVDSVRLVLQPGLVDEAERQRLWSAGKRRAAYRVGFLVTCPETLPMDALANPKLKVARPALASLIAADNPFARLFVKLLDAPGQAWLTTVAETFGGLTRQEVAIALMNAVGDHCREARLGDGKEKKVERLLAEIPDRIATAEGPLAELRDALPGLRDEITAMLVLGQVSEYLLDPILGHTDAVGSVLRKRLTPLTDPLLAEIAKLR
ncbi:hypothetical protein [Endothiovibrio diazotrophicus]